MSSTISTAKRVAAFQSLQGNTMYVLFEETYESNVSPKTPRWSCVAFGDAAAAMDRVFKSASACEGGMLRYRGGGVLPENYIAGWMRELANPVDMADCTVELSVSGSFYSTWSEDSFAEKKDALRTIEGMGSIIARLEAKERVKLSLFENAELLADLVNNHQVSQWRLFNIHSTNTLSVFGNALAFSPTPVKAPVPAVPEAKRLDENNYLLRAEDGSWYVAGWAYSIVGQYIVNEVLPAEMKAPGCYKQMIKAMRQKLEDAPKLEQDMTVTISKVVLDRNPWWLKQVKEFFDPHVTSSGDAIIPVPFPFGGEPNEWYALSRLDKDDATWTVGLPAAVEQAAPVTNPPGFVYFETDPVKVGSHQWRIVVHESHKGYGPVTEHQFRQPDAYNQSWCTEKAWPSWDGNLSNCGLPESLVSRLYEPFKDLIKKALEGVVVQPPQLTLF